MKSYNIHAGHAPYGTNGAYGAVAILNESNEARNVKNKLITLLRKNNNTVYDCTCDKAYSQDKVLKHIVILCNQHNVDLDISIHLNAGRNDNTGDGNTGGVEVYGYDENVAEIAKLICSNISTKLNIHNRGFKVNKNLYVLKNTKNKAILIECCFVDDKDDASRWNADDCAEAIYTALQSNKIKENDKQSTISPILRYRVHVQNKGWDEVKRAGEIAGTVGQALRVEAIKIDYPNHNVYAKAHIQGEGWKDYGLINPDTIIGTTGQNKRIECICLRGDFKYRIHIQGEGWTAWTNADGIATLGTVGQALRVEAIQIEEI